MNDECLARARELILRATTIADRLAIALVCCHQYYTEASGDYKRQSIDTRFYTEQEFEDFVTALRRHDIFVAPFFAENEFIAWVTEDGPRRLDAPYLLVFTSGASNPGLGAKSLVPAYCRLHGLEIVGPDAHAATIARHKFHFSRILASCGVSTPATWLYKPDAGWLNGETPPHGLQVLLKPCCEAAGIGIDANALVEVDCNLPDILRSRCSEFKQPMLVQEFIAGEEFDVPQVMSIKPFSLGPVGISLLHGERIGTGFLSYEATMADRYSFYQPSSYDSTLTRNLIAQTLRGAMALGLRDLVRLDFRVGADGVPRVIDVSTSPYLSKHSAFAFAYEQLGGDPQDLPLLLMGTACERLGWT